MAKNKIIRCSLQDYFESACVQQAKIKLLLKDGTELSGVAKDLNTRNKCEWLMLQVAEDNREIDLMDIEQLEFLRTGEKIKLA
ncbi:Rho-binding antiterminator [Aliikangiella sp. G2MR2-5]|uniref:Rho-binding antiterminator n=1 Tax=Aliikangiella sp. G2MR2-5 TaxID=2788943 RepID=UPI0018AC7713|nr:Rho-binding antiterminator [Aliikangiella sp. G2MR2-5]